MNIIKAIAIAEQQLDYFLSCHCNDSFYTEEAQELVKELERLKEKNTVKVTHILCSTQELREAENIKNGKYDYECFGVQKYFEKITLKISREIWYFSYDSKNAYSVRKGETYLLRCS